MVQPNHTTTCRLVDVDYSEMRSLGREGKGREGKGYPRPVESGSRMSSVLVGTEEGT